MVSVLDQIRGEKSGSGLAVRVGTTARPAEIGANARPARINNAVRLEEIALSENEACRNAIGDNEIKVVAARNATSPRIITDRLTPANRFRPGPRTFSPYAMNCSKYRL